MNDVKKNLQGVFSPMCTPFLKNGALDMAGLEKNIEIMNKSGLKGYFILGTNGEYKTLSEDERIKIIKSTVAKAGKDKVVMAGTGFESTLETIRHTKIAADLGVRTVSLLMPNFFAKKITADAMINHIIAVADSSPVPVLLYNNPSVAAGVTIAPEVIDSVSRHENVAGIKDSSKETWPEIVKYDSDNFSVLAGSAGYFFDLLDRGGTGGVLSLANVFPDACAMLYNLYREKKMAEATELNSKLIDLNKKVSGSYGVAGVKYAMDLAGFTGGDPRMPLPALTGEDREKIRTDLAASGFIRQS